MSIKTVLSNIIIMLFIGLISCEAPHLNPLDPDNPNNPVAVIEGTVKTAKFPRLPLRDVTVTWVHGNTVVNTDTNGNFRFNSLERRNGWVYYQKEGYSRDSSFVNWENNSRVSLERFLNSIPKIDSIKFSSSTRNRFPDIQEFDLEFNVRINDEENDIDSVFVKNDDLEFLELLEFNPSTRFYELFIPNDNLNFSSIEQVIGKDFEIIVMDNLKQEFSIGSSNIERIIKGEIDFISPANSETVSSPLTLRWRRFEPGFDFTFRIEIFTNDILQTLEWDVDDISMSEVNLEINRQLDPGQYFWVIWCIDEFGNKGSSKPATFQVN